MCWSLPNANYDSPSDSCDKGNGNNNKLPTSLLHERFVWRLSLRIHLHFPHLQRMRYILVRTYRWSMGKTIIQSKTNGSWFYHFLRVQTFAQIFSFSRT